MTNDRKRLESTAKMLLEGLKATKLGDRLRFKKNVVVDVSQHPNGGWSGDVATWQGRLTVGLSLDQYTSAPQRSFWVGFWSKNPQPIRDLCERLPRELKPDHTFGTSMVELKKNVWVLKQPLKRALFGIPIAEYYEEDEQYFGFYSSSEALDITRAVNFISNVIVAQEDDADEESVDIRLIVRNNELTETEKDQLIRARRGQGKFREGLESIWTDGCPITGHKIRELLRASHIMPWREADNFQRLDPQNGILLCANLDALFDKHLISFSDDGKLLISSRLSDDERRRLGILDEKKISFSGAQIAYLKHHRVKYEEQIHLASACRYS